METENGEKDANLLRRLVHELGHAAGTPEGLTGMTNVNKWENPIASQFDGFWRSRYSDEYGDYRIQSTSILHGNPLPSDLKEMKNAPTVKDLKILIP